MTQQLSQETEKTKALSLLMFDRNPKRLNTLDKAGNKTKIRGNRTVRKHAVKCLATYFLIEQPTNANPICKLMCLMNRSVTIE